MNPSVRTFAFIFISLFFSTMAAHALPQKIKFFESQKKNKELPQKLESSSDHSSSSESRHRKKNKHCSRGPQGHRGDRGPAGVQGAPGPQGPQGKAGAGAIIPFGMSGRGITLTPSQNIPSSAQIITFSSNSTSPAPLIDPMNLNDTNLFTPVSEAFTVSREVIINALSVYYVFPDGATTLILPEGAEVTIYAQLYQSTPPNNLFTPIAGSLITLWPPLKDTLSKNSIATGSSTDLNIAVPAGSRLLLAFYAIGDSSIPIPCLFSGGLELQ